jgi:hypothetical protein
MVGLDGNRRERIIKLSPGMQARERKEIAIISIIV